MQFAVIKEQGITFGIVVVKDYVIENHSEADEAVQAWSYELGCPTVLMGANRHKVYGRRDLVNFVSRLHLSQIPWRRRAA